MTGMFGGSGEIGMRLIYDQRDQNPFLICGVAVFFAACLFTVRLDPAGTPSATYMGQPLVPP